MSNASLSTLPSPQQLLEAQDASHFFVAGGTPDGTMPVPAAGLAANNTTVVGLASQTQYMLVLAARDAAAPVPNAIRTLVLLQLSAPDVKPPVFTGAGF